MTTQMTVQNKTVTETLTYALTYADAIPELTKAEARVMAEEQFARCLTLLEQLDGDDWQQPTDCTEWDVFKMTAHLAGACTGYSGWGHFLRQYLFNPYMRLGEEPVDGVNRRQIKDRAQKSPSELIAEFRMTAPKAVNTRQGHIPNFIKAIRMPLPPMGWLPIGYLLDTIYTRDQWMHCFDIARATGRTLALDPEHDGRMVALVMYDVNRKLREKFEGSIRVNLTGALVASYQFGTQGEPDTVITIDVVEFNRRASGRITSDEALHKAEISGDENLALWFIENCTVLY